jgi:hypothetical protein
MNPIAKAVIVASVLLFCMFLGLFLYGINAYSNTIYIESNTPQNIDSTTHTPQSIDSTTHTPQSIDSTTRQSISMLFWLMFGLLFERVLSSAFSVFYRMYFAKLATNYLHSQTLTLFTSFKQASIVFKVFELIHVLSIIGLSAGFMITYGSIDITTLNSNTLKLMNLFLNLFMVCLCSIFVQIFIIFGGIYFERRYILRLEMTRIAPIAARNMFMRDLAIVRNNRRATRIQPQAIPNEPETPAQPEIPDEHPSIESTEEVSEVEELEWDGRLEQLQESNV